MPLEAEVLDLPFERVAQLALAEDQEPRIRHRSHDARRGGHQMALALVRRQRRDVADERHVARQPERGARVGGVLLVDEADVDAVVHDLDAIGRDAVG